MYFGKYGLQNTWLDNCLKSPVSEEPLRGNRVNGRSTDSISTTAPLPYSLIYVQVTQLEGVSVNDMENLNTVC